ncbi:MAG: HlyD family efflux transporter periplasmic adaptor subunit [Gemmatimonadetes bacterium]|nr:HlyD family efflux transporter periplasmic adaptor subunit [Gemmatimonadota bacterium]
MIRFLRPVVPLCLLGIAPLTACDRTGPRPMTGRGTVEFPEIDLGPPAPARVVAVRVDEGADVAPGDTLVLFAQAELPATIAAGRARVAMAQSALADLERGARPEELGRAQAELAAATAEAERTATDLERARSLYQRDVIAKQVLDQASTAAAVAAERRRAADETMALLKAGSRQDRIAMAAAELASARASLAMVEARSADLVVTAPLAGRVLLRLAEPGEFLGAGTPALTLGDRSRPFVRVFLPAADLARIRIGDRVAVRPDGGDSTATASGRVVAVNTKAEFTPRVALTEQERADLMFGVKVELDPGTTVHPGLWVTVTFAAEPTR